MKGAKWTVPLKKADYVKIWLKNEITVRFCEIQNCWDSELE